VSVWPAAIKAHRLAWAAGFTVMLGLVSRTHRTSSLEVPLVDWLVPVPVLIAIGSITVGLLPLYSAFGALEQTLCRTTSVRLGNTAISMILMAAACAPAAVREGAAELAVLIYVASVLAVIVIVDYAWCVGLAVGLAAVIADGSIDRPVTSALRAIPDPAVGCALLGAIALYWWAGPRESRSHLPRWPRRRADNRRAAGSAVGVVPGD